MMSLENTESLIEFRNMLYTFFPKRRDAIMNLLDALTSHGRQCDSVVQLSNMNCFERQYSSITDAIADGLPEAYWEDIEKWVHQKTNNNSDKPHRFVIDCTPNPRPHAKTLVDRHITHAPNPAPGNKPICVGHQYSVLTSLPDDAPTRGKHWLVPHSAKRVPSHQKGNEVGMQQIIDCIESLGLADEMTISIGDSLYGTENCRVTAAQQKNLVHQFRLNSKRNVFFKPSGQHSSSSKTGRKKEFGAKMNLSDPSTQPDSHEEANTEWISRRGKRYKVRIQCWNDVLLRGSRTFRSSQHPLRLIKVSVTDEHGELLFKRPLWLALFGERRHEIELIDAYQNYASRYDIEHFFRFGKRNLLMDSYQTPDVEHEELWWKLCMVAYTQLYLAKDLVPNIPQPWERYLPEYKASNNQQGTVSTPSKTQRGFAHLLKAIGTPAKPCVTRGKAKGRMVGETQPKKEIQAIAFKTKKVIEQVANSVLPGSEETTSPLNPQRIEELIKLVQASLTTLDLTPSEFSKMLVNSS